MQQASLDDLDENTIYSESLIWDLRDLWVPDFGTKDLHPSLAMQPVPLLRQTQLKTEIDTGLKYAEDAEFLTLWNQFVHVSRVFSARQSWLKWVQWLTRTGSGVDRWIFHWDQCKVIDPQLAYKTPTSLAMEHPFMGRFFIDFLRSSPGEQLGRVRRSLVFTGFRPGS